MELTKKQFDVLVALAEAKLSQRELEEKTGYSLGTVNKAVRELCDLGYVSDGALTALGLAALEPYRAKRASPPRKASKYSFARRQAPVLWFGSSQQAA